MRLRLAKVEVQETNGGWVGGVEERRIKLNSAKVEIEVEAEFGNNSNRRKTKFAFSFNVLYTYTFLIVPCYSHFQN